MEQRKNASKAAQIVLRVVSAVVWNCTESGEYVWRNDQDQVGGRICLVPCCRPCCFRAATMVDIFQAKCSWMQHSVRSFLVDFTTKTFDVSFLCVLRVVLVVTSAIAAIKVGDEKIM